jgi:hypothetical protein
VQNAGNDSYALEHEVREVICDVAGCSVLAAAWTFAFIQLATTWYVAGKAEALYR